MESYTRKQAKHLGLGGLLTAAVAAASFVVLNGGLNDASAVAMLPANQSVLSILEGYYSDYPVAGGWRFQHAVNDNGQVLAQWVIPSAPGVDHEHMQGIMRNVLCPNPVWGSAYSSVRYYAVNVMVSSPDGYSNQASCS